MDKVALGQVFLPSASFFPVSIILPLLHTRLCVHVAHTRRIKGLLQTSSFLSKEKKRAFYKQYLHFLLYVSL
jgi:hypothetical protein